MKLSSLLIMSRGLWRNYEKKNTCYNTFTELVKEILLQYPYEAQFSQQDQCSRTIHTGLLLPMLFFFFVGVVLSVKKKKKQHDNVRKINSIPTGWGDNLSVHSCLSRWQWWYMESERWPPAVFILVLSVGGPVCMFGGIHDNQDSLWFIWSFPLPSDVCFHCYC